MKSLVSFPRYEGYKESGIDWLGEVPKNWTINRLGGIFSERREKVSDIDFPPLSVTKNGVVPQLENAAKTQDGDNRKKVKIGDFVINSRSDRKGSSGISFLDGSVSLINIVLEPKEVELSFINYLLKSYSFVEEYYRVGRGIVADLWTTRYSEMKDILLAIPTKVEQNLIATYLDQKTTQIDQAIEIKKKQIELLKERQQVVIQQAVTKGLDPAVRMKDSGIEWIGEVPEHWEVKKLKYLLDEINIRSTTGAEVLLSLSKYHGVIPRNTLEERAGGAESLIGYKHVAKEDLVINKMQAVTGLLAVSKLNGITSPDYSVYRSKNIKILNINYLGYLLSLPEYLGEFKKRVTGVMEGFIRLYTDDLYSISVVLPSVEAQVAIVRFLSDKALEVDKAVALLKKQIHTLQEYKSSLINSAVTGKIKITTDMIATEG